MEFEISAELVGIYLEDAREHLAVVDAALLRLEREGSDPEIAASLLGPLHTLKGNSGMMGFTAVKDYVHRLEEVLGRARDGALRARRRGARSPAAGRGGHARRGRVAPAAPAGSSATSRRRRPRSASCSRLAPGPGAREGGCRGVTGGYRRSRSRGCGRRSRSAPVP